MSKALITKMKAEAVGHELKAAEMLRCAKRLLDLTARHNKVARGLCQATAALGDGKKRGRGRPRKTWTGSLTADNCKVVDVGRPEHHGRSVDYRFGLNERGHEGY